MSPLAHHEKLSAISAEIDRLVKAKVARQRVANDCSGGEAEVAAVSREAAMLGEHIQLRLWEFLETWREQNVCHVHGAVRVVGCCCGEGATT